MPNDSLNIFGTTYTNVAGIIATDTNDTDRTFIRPQGTKVISANGTGIDVAEYANVDVNVSSGITTLTMGTIRPDAELVKTFSYDKYIVADEEITIPAYTTTQTTLKATEALQETYTVSYTDYNWYILLRTLTIPEYSVTSKAKGRQEYHFSSTMYEVVEVEANTINTLLDPTVKVTSRTASMPAMGAFYRLVYWTKGTEATAYSTGAYGAHQNIVAPALSSGVITFNTPDFRIRGHTTYFTNTYFNALTDIRYQWVIKVYRAPKSNLNLDGWGQNTQAKHIIECAQSSTHKLT